MWGQRLSKTYASHLLLPGTCSGPYVKKEIPFLFAFPAPQSPNGHASRHRRIHSQAYPLAFLHLLLHVTRCTISFPTSSHSRFLSVSWLPHSSLSGTLFLTSPITVSSGLYFLPEWRGDLILLLNISQTTLINILRQKRTAKLQNSVPKKAKPMVGFLKDAHCRCGFSEVQPTILQTLSEQDPVLAVKTFNMLGDFNTHWQP